MRGGVVQIKGCLIHVTLAEGEEIRLLIVPADFKAKAPRLQARSGGVFEDDFKKFVDLQRIDLEDDNNVDHECKREAIFAEHATCVLRIMALTSPSHEIPTRPPHAVRPQSSRSRHQATTGDCSQGGDEACPRSTSQGGAQACASHSSGQVRSQTCASPCEASTTPRNSSGKARNSSSQTRSSSSKARSSSSHTYSLPPPAKPPAPKPVAIFPDKALEAAVRKQVFAKRDNQEVITAEDVATVSIIEGKKAGIKDLTGLEKCKSLASLTLPENQITNLAPIKGLERLQFLDVSNNQISDITPLAACKALQYIELTGNKVTDVSALGGIQSLTSLYLANNQIKDATSLFKLPKVWTLYLEGNQVNNIAGIGGMKWLSMLSLKGNGVKGTPPLEPLTELQFLFLETTRSPTSRLCTACGKRTTTARVNGRRTARFSSAGTPLTMLPKSSSRR